MGEQPAHDRLRCLRLLVGSDQRSSVG